MIFQVLKKPRINHSGTEYKKNDFFGSELPRAADSLKKLKDSAEFIQNRLMTQRSKSCNESEIKFIFISSDKYYLRQ